MAHKLYKFRLLLDEMFPPRLAFPRLNHRHTVKHVIHDFSRKPSPKPILDPEVMKLAEKTGSVVVTMNTKDFFKFTVAKSAGIIGISPNVSNEQIDLRTTSLLSKSTKNQIYGHVYYITSSTIDRIR